MYRPRNLITSSPFTRFFASTSLAFAMTTSLAIGQSWYGEHPINGSFEIGPGDIRTLDNNLDDHTPASLLLGTGSGEEGILTMTGGYLTANALYSINTLDFGHNGGTGIVNMSGGTILLIDGYSYNRMRVGNGSGSTGTFNQSGGLVETGAGSVSIGYEGGTGTYNLSGNATLKSGNVFHVGRGLSNGGAHSEGTLNISDTATFSLKYPIEGWLYLGRWDSTGTIHQQGSSEVAIEIVGGVILGTGGESTGTYQLDGGNLSITSSYGVRLGDTAEATGTFTQTNGTSHFEGKAILVGNEGAGTFTVSGGTSTVKNGITLGQTAGSEGTLEVSGEGILEVGGTAGIKGGSGTAEFNLNGGELRVIDNDLTVGVSANLVEASTSTINTNGFDAHLTEGFSGTGGFAKIGFGALIAGGTTVLAGNSSSEGDFIISGPDDTPASFTVSEDTGLEITARPDGGSQLIVGEGTGNAGVLNVDGGVVTFHSLGKTNNFDIGQNGGTGTVNMTDGSITFDDDGGGYSRLRVGSGAGSTGAFNQSGGSVDTATGSFNIGYEGGIGVYNLSEDASLNSVGVVHIGRGLSAGGVNSVGSLVLTDSASFNMVTTDTEGSIYLGRWDSTGTIHQKDSSQVTIDIRGIISLGNGGASTGTYQLDNGSLSMKSRSYGLYLGDTNGATGRFIQNGGTSLFDGKLGVQVGNSGSGEFTLNGGTATLKTGIVLGRNAGSDGTLNLNAGTLETGADITKGAGDAEFNLGGGRLRAIDNDVAVDVDVSLTDLTISTIDTNSLNVTLSGVVSGNGGLAKDGDGILTLSGDNSYTGFTQVNAGTLSVAAGGKTGSGVVIIGVNGALSGTGVVQGAAFVQGALNPGNSPGNLTFANGLNLTDTSVTTMEIGGIAEGEYDKLTIASGGLALDGILTLDITDFFNGTFSFDLFDIDINSTISGNFNAVLLTGVYGSGAFVQDGTNWTIDIDGNAFAFNAQTGDLGIVAAIPEPGTWTLLAITAVALLLFHQRSTGAASRCHAGRA